MYIHFLLMNQNLLYMKYARIKNIPKKPKRLYDEALSKSYHYWIDEKGSKNNPDCWRRDRSDLTYEEAFSIIEKNKPHWVISYRNVSYINKVETDYWEFSACNIGENSYGDVFIWILLTEEEANKIFEKYKLKIDEY